MRSIFYLTALLVLHQAHSEESSWSWGAKQKEETPGQTPDISEKSSNGFFNDQEELVVAPSEYEEIKSNSTEAEQVIDEILSSTRAGRAIDGFDEVYSDPNVQEALQNGDDTEARNIIKDRLCALGLMQCDGVEEKRPFYTPEELIYAQPVSINPVGKPIPTIPLKGNKGVGYGPPKPVPYPNRPPGKFPPNKFGPPTNPAYYQQGKPPRRHFGVPPSKPFYGKPGGNGEIYEGGEFFNKPPTFTSGLNQFIQPIEPEIPPYKFEQGSAQFGQHKDKRVEITVHAQGGNAAAIGSTGNKGSVEHVHHHYHHNLDGGKPAAINPIPIASAAVTTTDLLSSNAFGTSSGNYGSFKPSPSIGVSTSSGLSNFGSTNGFSSSTNGFGGSTNGFSSSTNGFGGSTNGFGGATNGFGSTNGFGGATNGFGSTNGFQQSTYGGQSIVNYGGVKPVSEGYPDQSYDSFGASVGSFGSSNLYKKELNLNAVNNNYLQGGYADKYQGLESARAENYDCICVPYDQCPSHDIIGRKDDLYLPLDPRNLKSDIEAINEEERVITDGNGTMTVVRVNKDSGLNGTGVVEVKEEGKKISKRETSDVDAKLSTDKPEARQNNYGSFGNLDMKNIKPTFGISFGLPQQSGGGYPVNPYGQTPFANPYPVGQTGINLGLVSVNPLVSVQVSKDDYGKKEIKPFVNLHVTPNDYLIHKFSDLFNYKKAVIFNKHKHYHVHNGHHYPSHYSDDIYREHPNEFEHGPPFVHNSPVLEHPINHHHQKPFLHNSPNFEDPHYEPNYPDDSYPQHNPNFFENQHAGSYFDDPLNYGGGEYHPEPFYGRNFQNNTNFVNGNNILQQYQNHISHGVNLYGQDNEEGFENSRLRNGKSFRIDTPIKFPSSRKRREIERQFHGGRPQVCGPRHVCCKRPLRPQVPQNNRQCGTRHTQGVNGRIKNPVYVDGDSEFGEYPWQVAILKKDSKESVYVCGGTLIDPLHIITAAHCVKSYTGFDLRARLGEWDVNHDVEFYPYIERDVVSVHVHPEFYAGTLYNDIAILKMDKPVDWTKYPHISPACLPRYQEDYTGARCWTTGWGKDAFGDFGKYQNILKEVDVPIVDSGVCQRQLQQTRLGYDFKLHPGFICAGGEEGKDACKGDGGGPMVCERGGTWQVVGIVSWGIGCGQTGVPGVYVKVGYYLDWIKQITQRF